MRQRYFSDVSPEALAFLKRLLCFDQKERPTAAEALKDPWITNPKTSQKLSMLESFGNLRASKTFNNYNRSSSRASRSSKGNKSRSSSSKSRSSSRSNKVVKNPAQAPAQDMTPLQQVLQNLMKPKQYKLKMIVYTYVVGQMLQIKERQEMADVFKQIDVNLDGRITVQQLIDSYQLAFGVPADAQ